MPTRSAISRLTPTVAEHRRGWVDAPGWGCLIFLVGLFQLVSRLYVAVFMRSTRRVEPHVTLPAGQKKMMCHL